MNNHPFEEDHWRDRTYIGDGVYAAHDGWQIWLCTTDGVTASQKIALEPIVLSALVSYARRVGVIEEKRL